MIASTPQSKLFYEKLKEKLDSLQQPLTLILHVGTPKTGTTSLQIYLDKQQGKLRELGVLYPNRSHNADAPKHQWFEKNLVRTHPENFLDNFMDILDDVEENTHTILLSSEGIYNLWWDFPEESQALLFELSKLFKVKTWVWFREPLSFAEDFYKQCMRNPVVKQIPCYGKDLSFAEILADPWFSKHLDYMGFVKDCDQLFGEAAISIFEYGPDTVKTACQLLGLAPPNDNSANRKNTSLSPMTAEFYRVLNRMELTAKQKERIVPCLHDLNAALMPYEERYKSSLVDDESRDTIIQMTAEAMLALNKRYTIV